MPFPPQKTGDMASDSAALYDDLAGEIERKKVGSALSEDGWAVIIGTVLITAALAVGFSSPDFRFTSPIYQWANTDELFTKVLSVNNLLLVTGIGLIFLFLSAIAIRLSGGSVKNYSTGFILIYILGVGSLIIAGNKSINSYGIEYVVFALIIG